MAKIPKYDDATEATMRLYYSQLSEKDKRHYAAVEAMKLPYGGKGYIVKVLNISYNSIRKGIKEMKTASLRLEIPEGKQRRVGGGRKKKN